MAAVIGVHEDEQHDETEIYKEMDKEFIQKWLRGTTTINTTRRRKY
jgi:hypothetical protein